MTALLALLRALFPAPAPAQVIPAAERLALSGAVRPAFTSNLERD